MNFAKRSQSIIYKEIPIAPAIENSKAVCPHLLNMFIFHTKFEKATSQ